MFLNGLSVLDVTREQECFSDKDKPDAGFQAISDLQMRLDEAPTLHAGAKDGVD